MEMNITAEQQQPTIKHLVQQRRQLLQQLGTIDRQLMQAGVLSQRTVQPRRERKARKRE